VPGDRVAIVTIAGGGWAGLSGAGEQAADLVGGEADQIVAVVIMLLACPGKLPAGGGAPFERR
jgi:hypothetical protein